jgi:hypothetical protein
MYWIKDWRVGKIKRLNNWDEFQNVLENMNRSKTSYACYPAYSEENLAEKRWLV